MYSKLQYNYQKFKLECEEFQSKFENFQNRKNSIIENFEFFEIGEYKELESIFFNVEYINSIKVSKLLC